MNHIGTHCQGEAVSDDHGGDQLTCGIANQSASAQESMALVVKDDDLRLPHKSPLRQCVAIRLH